MKKILVFIPRGNYSVANLGYMIFSHLSPQKYEITLVFGFKNSFVYFKNQFKNCMPFSVMYLYENEFDDKKSQKNYKSMQSYLQKCSFDYGFIIEWDDAYFKLFPLIREFFEMLFLNKALRKFIIYPFPMATKPWNHPQIEQTLYLFNPFYPLNWLKTNSNVLFTYNKFDNVKQLNILKAKKTIKIFLAPLDFYLPFLKFDEQLFLMTLNRFLSNNKNNVSVYLLDINNKKNWCSKLSKYSFKIHFIPSTISIDNLNDILSTIDISLGVNFWGFIWQRIFMSGSICMLINNAFEPSKLLTECESCEFKNLYVCAKCLKTTLFDNKFEQNRQSYLSYVNKIKNEFKFDGKVKKFHLQLKKRLEHPNLTNDRKHWLLQYLFFHGKYYHIYFNKLDPWLFYKTINTLQIEENIKLLSDVFKKDISSEYVNKYEEYRQLNNSLKTFSEILETL